jgi:hypothetical protein
MMRSNCGVTGSSGSGDTVQNFFDNIRDLVNRRLSAAVRIENCDNDYGGTTVWVSVAHSLNWAMVPELMSSFEFVERNLI